MKILVMSDSHSSLRFMHSCIQAVQPDVMIHLGDFFEDAQAVAEDYPHIPLIQVPGNCDRWRISPGEPEIIVTRVDGVDLYLTHGHHANPDNLPPLEVGSIFLSGHTHVKIDKEVEGIRCLNPGSVSIPKDGSHSCLIFEKGDFRFHIWED